MPGGARRKANPLLQRGAQPRSKPRTPKGCGRRFPIRGLSSPARPAAEGPWYAHRGLAGDQHLGVRDDSSTYDHFFETVAEPHGVSDPSEWESSRRSQ